MSHNWLEENGGGCQSAGALLYGGQNGIFSDNYVLRQSRYPGILLADGGPGWPATLNWQLLNNYVAYNQPVGVWSRAAPAESS